MNTIKINNRIVIIIIIYIYSRIIFFLKLMFSKQTHIGKIIKINY